MIIKDQLKKNTSNLSVSELGHGYSRSLETPVKTLINLRQTI
jgi:hypothetical protein